MSPVIEPDDRARGLSRYHKRIVKTARIARTRSGHVCELECGHSVQTFGDLKHTAGFVLCVECRNEATLARMGS